MLAARDLTLRRGPQPLFEQASFIVFRGNKAGITGANGAGKSSLFAAILGELAPDRGDIDLPAAVKIAHVEQEIAASSQTAIEFGNETVKVHSGSTCIGKPSPYHRRACDRH